MTLHVALLSVPRRPDLTCLHHIYGVAEAQLAVQCTECTGCMQRPSAHMHACMMHAGHARTLACTAGPLSTAPPAIGSIHSGTVHTIRPFGMFIAIEGYRRHVMVHHTQVRRPSGGSGGEPERWS